MLRAIITAEVYRNLCTLVEYLYRDEERHWEADGRPARHIFHDIKCVADWLDTLPVPRPGAH